MLVNGGGCQKKSEDVCLAYDDFTLVNMLLVVVVMHS